MSNKGKNILIAVLITIIAVLCGYIGTIYHRQPTVLAVWQPCVPDEEAAAGIAQVVCKSYVGYELEKDAFVVHDEDNEWRVTLKKYVPEGKFLGCDTSGIYINKQDGTITNVAIDKKEVEEYLNKR